MKNKKVLQIYFLVNKRTENQQKLIDIWSKIFNIECYFITKKSLLTLCKKRVHFLFVQEQAANRKDIDWEFINKVRIFNPTFKMIWVLNKFNSKVAPSFLKAGSDDMLYLDSGWEYIKWKTIALLRRKWTSFSNDNIVFHRGLIIDKIRGECILNEKLIELSKKEFEVLKCLVSAPEGNFVERSYIYKTVWKHDDNDTTRVVQQIIQNLKKKIGPDYFEIVRNKGIRLS